MLEIIAITVTLAIILIWYFLVRPLSYWTKLGVKQSKPWLIFGDSYFMLFQQTNLNDLMSKIYNMYPDNRYSGMYNFNSPVLVVRDPNLIKQITVKDFDFFTDRTPFMDPDADPLWSNSLVSLKGERWKEIRGILSPTFSSAKIKSIYSLMFETSENFVKYFLEKEEKIIEIDMKDSFTRFANDVIATTAFGIQVDSLKDRNNIFYEMGKKLTNFEGIWPIIWSIGHQAFPKLFKYLEKLFCSWDVSKYFYEVIDETIKAREERNIIRPDMIHLMLEAKKNNKVEINKPNVTEKSKSIKISNADIASQAMVFFFAGFETISSAMCFSSYELAVNKDIQDRLREEIFETQKDGEITYDRLMEMKYMDMVVSEILRKWPSFTSLDRICTKPYTIQPANQGEKPVPIKVDQEILIPIYGIQRDPKYFPNPDTFDPERFSDENKKNILPFTYMPFGAGPRICIATRFALLEVKVLLFTLLLNYEIVPTKKTPIPLVLANDYSQMPENGFWIGLKRLEI